MKPLLSRFHGFLLASAVLIGAVVLASGLVVGSLFERHQLRHEEEHTAKVVQTQARQHLVFSDFAPPRPGREPAGFAAFLRELPEVFRIKVFDRDGRVVWSDEPRLIGLAFPDNPYLARALRGEVATVLESPGRPEHLYERSRTYVVEAYVPIVFPGRPELVGVIETYKDAARLVFEIRQAQRQMWGVTGGIGLFLYVTLAFVVWQASRSEQRAIGRLEAQNRELTLIHQFTQSVLQPPDLERLAASVVESTGVGLGLARTALYRVGPGMELTRLARWPAGDPAAPLLPEALAADAVESRRQVSRGTTVALPIVTEKEPAYVFLAEFTRPVFARDLPGLRVLEIMLHETAIALANVELFTAIREAHERLAAILAGIADRMVIVDRQMRVVWLNAVAADAADAGPEALGRCCFEVLGAAVEACRECPAARTFLSGKVERGLRAQRLRSGEVRYLDLVTAPLRDGSGQVHQVLEVARDITELVELEERLKQSATRLEKSHMELLAKTGELEQANRALRETQAQLVEKERLAAVGQLVVGLHHAILNPLAGILGALRVLEEDGIAPAAKAEALAQAEAAIHQIEQLIRRLPALRRAAATPYVGETTMLDLEPPRAEVAPELTDHVGP
ncbi:MAG: PAS domain-containing protein [Candidatus Rokubacteria bacterium]|nr:PAS domain-containing protein [Candidatus Rokubacteria bacterium]